MRKLIAAAVLGLACLPVAVSQAAVTVYAQYNLGEAGSLAGAENLPQDSVGGHNFTNAFGSSTVTATGGAVNNGAYVTTGQYSGWIGTNAFSTLPTDNVGYGIWVKATNTGDQGPVTAVGSMGIDLIDSWAPSIYYVDFFGSPATFTADTWTHLAMIRQNGTTTFYANGVAQGAPTTLAFNPDSYSTPGLAMDPKYDGTDPANQGIFFQGGMDDFRVVSFSGTDSTASILNSLTAPVPEPTSLGLLLTAGVLMSRRSRKA